MEQKLLLLLMTVAEQHAAGLGHAYSRAPSRWCRLLLCCLGDFGGGANEAIDLPGPVAEGVVFGPRGRGRGQGGYWAPPVINRLYVCRTSASRTHQPVVPDCPPPPPLGEIIREKRSRETPNRKHAASALWHHPRQ